MPLGQRQSMNTEGDIEVAAVVRLAVVCCLVRVVMFFGIILYLTFWNCDKQLL
jgi:phage shock protein PspC (stress-responsive transcriptional regulator)